MQENLCLRFVNNKSADLPDQPAHRHRLISPFVICVLESIIIISKFATTENSIFLLVSVAEETGLSLILSETPKTGFVTLRPI